MLQNAAPALIAPPHDFEAEASLLGSLIALSLTGQGAKALESIHGLSPEDFYRDGHRILFVAIGEMMVAGMPVDLTTLRAELERRSQLDKAGGEDYITNLALEVPVAGNVGHYARIVRRLSLERDVRRLGRELADGECDIAQADKLLALTTELEMLEAGGPIDPTLGMLRGAQLEAVKQPEWIVHDLLRKTVLTLLAGPPRQGKSLTAEALSIHLATGKDFGLFKIDKPRRVAYFSAEDGPELTGPRLMALSRGLGFAHIPEECAYFFKAFKIDEPSGNKAIRKRVKFAQAEVVVFDVLLNFHSADENDNGAMATVMQHFIALARELEIAVMLLHHHRKSSGQGDEGDAIDKSRGASAISGSCPIIISGRRSCYHVHSKYGTVDDFALKLDEGTAEGQEYMILKAHAPADSDEAREHQMSAITAIIELSAGGSTPVSIEQVVEKLHSSRRSVDNWVRSAVQSGRIIAEKGPYGRNLYKPKV
jgi:hypothetical protein